MTICFRKFVTEWKECRQNIFDERTSFKQISLLGEETAYSSGDQSDQTSLPFSTGI